MSTKNRRAYFQARTVSRIDDQRSQSGKDEKSEKPDKEMPEMGLAHRMARVLTGGLMLPFVVIGVMHSTFFMMGFLPVVIYLCVKEFHWMKTSAMKRLFPREGDRRTHAIFSNPWKIGELTILIYLLHLFSYISGSPSSIFFTLCVCVYFIATAFSYLVRCCFFRDLEGCNTAPASIMLSYFGVDSIFAIFFICPCLAFTFFHCLDHGGAYVVLVMIIRWLSDTCGVLFQSVFGSRLLCPIMSAKKTIEGVVAASLISVPLSLLLFEVRALDPFDLFPQIKICHAIGIGQAVVIGNTMGDLLESALRAAANVKDSGDLFPAHYGMLDRMNSLGLSMGVVYMYVRVVMRVPISL